MEVDAIARCSASRVWAASPVCVGLGGQRQGELRADVESGGECALHIEEDALDQHEVRLPGNMHEEAHLLDGIC